MPKISQYPPMSTLTGSEILLGDQAGVTSTATALQVSAMTQKATLAIDSGVVNAYILTSTPAPAALAAGQLVLFTPLNTNTGAVTINYNGHGAIAALGWKGQAMSGGELSSVGPAWLEYTGSAWQLIATIGAQAGYQRQGTETTAGVVPANYTYLPGDSRRYALDPTGATDCTNVFNAVLAALGQAAATTGQVNELVLWPGNYLVRRLYMNYSHLYIKGMGATITQTLVGITNSQTTGTTPAYAVIHINPLNYTVNPGAPITAIKDVRVYGDLTIQGPNPGSAISGITQAANAVVTISTVSAVNPYSVGLPIGFIYVAGMTQINAVVGTVTAIGGVSGAWTITTNINSSAFSAYTSGGTITAAGYSMFQLGVVSNDCNNCWVHDILVQGCGAENILMGPSAWNTCRDLRIFDCEVSQGGEVGINNARGWQITRNVVHDSWFQNGVGGDGDGGICSKNIIFNMAGGGLTPGGSGARDLTPNGVSRDIIFSENITTSTGLSISNTYAMFASDDGATTVPKQNHRYIGNTLNAHNGPVGLGCDYNTATNICIENNTITNCVSPGGTGQDFNVVAGSGLYYLRGNNFNPGPAGNNAFGVTNGSAGTPTIVVEEGNDISGHSVADVNIAVAGIVMRAEYLFSLTLSLTGFAAAQNVPVEGVLHGNKVCMNLTGTVAASNSTTCTLGTLPTYLRPIRNQNIVVPVTSSNNPILGICQVAPSGVITFFTSVAGGAFVNDGLNKGITGPYNLEWILN